MPKRGGKYGGTKVQGRGVPAPCRGSASVWFGGIWCSRPSGAFPAAPSGRPENKHLFFVFQNCRLNKTESRVPTLFHCAVSLLDQKFVLMERVGALTSSAVHALLIPPEDARNWKLEKGFQHSCSFSPKVCCSGPTRLSECR